MSVYDAAYEVDWERVPLPPGRLAELNQRSDLLGLAQALGHLGLMAATGAAAWVCAAQGWWLAFALALFAHGTMASFMINAVHELVHGTVFRTRWLNTVFVHVFAFVGWINHRGFWASHAEHHLYTLHHPHDSEVVLPIRFGIRGFVQGAILNPFGMTWPLRHQWRLARGRIADGWESKVLISADRRRAVVSWSRSLFLGHAAVWAVSAWQGWWLLPILVSLTPCYGHLLFSLLNNTQHVGLKAGATDFRENCRTIEVNAVFRFLYWHMNYHIEHHMYAAVPCYRLRALHREIAHALPPTPKGLAAAWGQIIYDVVRQKAEPGWYERPAIPGKGAGVAESAPVSATKPTAIPTQAATITAKVWRCSICGFIYDETVGLPAEGIAAGTAWADIPAEWTCPDCGIAKADFAMVEVARPASAASSTDDRAPVVVVGAGMAATGLIEDLRRRDAVRRIVQVTADAGDRYAKPQLSVALARGQAAADLVAESAMDWSRRVGVDLRPHTRALAIDARQRVLKTDAGDIAYGDLVLATGAVPMPLSLEGDAADAAFRINHLDDYRAFRGALKPGARVAILGAGLIGCEFANDLAQAGHAVTVIDPAPQPLGRIVPAEVGSALASALAGLGIDLRLGRSVRRIDRAAAGKTMILDDGDRVAADLVLVAIGLVPRLDLAKTAGLACARGIIVDGSFATSVAGIHALGDAVEIGGKVLPFVQPLQEGARVLAAALCGERQRADCSACTISVKTPALPLLIAPARSEGTWTVEHQTKGLIARCTAEDGSLAGFVLAGTGVAQRQALVQEWTGSPALAR